MVLPHKKTQLASRQLGFFMFRKMVAASIYPSRWKELELAKELSHWIPPKTILFTEWKTRFAPEQILVELKRSHHVELGNPYLKQLAVSEVHHLVSTVHATNRGVELSARHVLVRFRWT